VSHPEAALQIVVFDLDGTLVDTADDFIPVVQQLRAEHDLPPLDPQRVRRSVSNGARALVHLALGLAPAAPGHEAARARLLELYAAVLGRHSRLYPGMRELLAQLEARGIAWGIATNKPRAYTLPLLEALDLAPAPGAVSTPDDVRLPKPDPESLLQICAALGAAPQNGIYAGDHLRDIEAGRSAGMHTIAAAYGYIESDDDPGRWQADALAGDSEELAALVLTPAAAQRQDTGSGANAGTVASTTTDTGTTTGTSTSQKKGGYGG